MAMPTALRAGLDYVRKNPLTLLTAAKQAARLRITVPLDLVRWGVAKIRSSKVSDFAISSAPPGIGVGLTASVMGSQLRVGGVVKIDEITVGPGTLRIELRLHELAIKSAEGAAASPITQMLGAVDLGKPGNLVSFLPKKPALLVEAKDDRFVLDLMKVGKLGQNKKLMRALDLISPVLAIRDVEVSGDDLLIGLRIRPTGLPSALAALRA
jgi:hypothetical protein